jgi:bile acid:Na+ symporter, BASS family
LKTPAKGPLLLLAMLVGALLPQISSFSFLIRYLLMAMLFLAFLDIEFKPKMFHSSMIWVLIANIMLPFLGYALLARYDHTLAMAAFMTAIAPTAIAAPVIIGFINRKVEYVVTSVIFTNITTAIVIPLVLPTLLGAEVQISVWEVLRPVLIVMFVPLILARFVSYLPETLQSKVSSGRRFSFPIWLVNLVLISANASNFLRTENSDSFSILILLGLISFLICIVNFGLGALLGGPTHWQEASQSLGQKNLSFVIWVALTFINPLVAMGPTFYILFHHLYNSWSIHQFERKQV